MRFLLGLCPKHGWLFQNREVYIKYISERESPDNVCKWNETRLHWLLWCRILTWVLVPFSPPLQKAVRACTGEKNPLDSLSGSHTGYMIKRECTSLSRPWLTRPGEILGSMIPWELDKLWSLDFFLCIHIILFRGFLHSSAAFPWPCTNS